MIVSGQDILPALITSQNEIHLKNLHNIVITNFPDIAFGTNRPSNIENFNRGCATDINIIQNTGVPGQYQIFNLRLFSPVEDANILSHSTLVLVNINTYNQQKVTGCNMLHGAVF